jgi:hypothetical protein
MCGGKRVAGRGQLGSATVPIGGGAVSCAPISSFGITPQPRAARAIAEWAAVPIRPPLVEVGLQAVDVVHHVQDTDILPNHALLLGPSVSG